MSALPYYLAIAMILCLMFIWSGLMLDMFDMRHWMHHITQFLETNLKV